MTVLEDRPLRVLHLLPDLAVGGGQVIVLNIVREHRPGVEHHVCAIGDGDIRARFDDAGVPVSIVRRSGVSGIIGVSRRVARLIESEGIDVVHTNNTPLDRVVGQLSASLAHRPVVNTFMAIATSHRSRQPGEPRRRYARRRAGNLANRGMTRWNVRQYVALSDAVGRSHAEALGIDRSRIQVVRPGLEAEAFRERSASDVDRLRAVLGVAGADPLLISVGRLDHNKAQHELPAMMRTVLTELPDAHLLIVGDGDTRQLVEREVAQHGVGHRVHLLGQRNDVPLLLAASDIFVSTARNEGFGMAALEAMAARNAIVAYVNENVAIGEFVADGEAGSLVVDNEPEPLARAVIEIARSRTRLASLADRAATDARSYTIARTAEQLEALYRGVVTEGGRR